MTRDQLLSALTARREEYRKVDAHVDGAKLIDDLLFQLNELWNHEYEAEVGLDQAEALSGYNERSLRRKVSEGKLPAQKRRGRLVFRVADLPRKRGLLDDPFTRPYDPDADARQVAARRIHGEVNHDAHQAP
jgi:hypothetical protein